MDLSFPPALKFILVLSAFTTVSAFADAGNQFDIKPVFPKDDFDGEQMRLAKVIHKRILDQQQKERQTPFAAYKEKLETGVEFEMLPIKGGTFTWKGTEKGDELEVTLSPFWMCKTEVIWEEYDPFMYPAVTREKDGSIPGFMREKIKNDFSLLARPTPPHHPMTFGMPRDGYPAISMTQHAANKYCQWLSYQTGHFYRLPTEAEWEYACLAGSDKKYSWGEDPTEAGNYAWLGGDAGSHYQKPAQKKPNAWGIYDMHGNVQEWTLDQYVLNRRAHFGKDKVTNPWVRATQPYPHVTKGGHWKQPAKGLKASARYQSSAAWKMIDPQDPKSLWYHTSAAFLGMRVVRPAKVPTAEEMYYYWNSGVAEDE